MQFASSITLHSTEKTYVYWIQRYILFHNKRHPQEMGKAEIEAFLTHLAVQGQVSASTQNQALSALLFLYREVLKLDIADIDAIRAKRPQYVPTVMTKQERHNQNITHHIIDNAQSTATLSHNLAHIQSKIPRPIASFSGSFNSSWYSPSYS